MNTESLWYCKNTCLGGLQEEIESKEEGVRIIKQVAKEEWSAEMTALAEDEDKKHLQSKDIFVVLTSG